MPAKKATSGVAAKLAKHGVSKVHEAHKGDEVKIGQGGDIPAGIEGGIAQLSECKFDEFKTGDNTGELYFFAAGIILEPTVFFNPVTKQKINLKGERTQVGPIPLCETKAKSTGNVTSFEQHYEHMLNELRKLGVDTTTISENDLEATAAALKDAAPIFKFRTWAGKPTTEFPNPRTNHDWRGLATDYTGETSGETAVDDAGVPDDGASEPQESDAAPDWDTLAAEADDADNADAKAAQEAINAAALAAGVDQKTINGADSWTAVVALFNGQTPDDAAEEAKEAGEGEVDYDALGELADAEDDESIAQLDDMGKAAGLNTEDSKAYPTWSALAAALKELAGGAAEPEFLPAKGETYPYKPKGAKKAIEATVLTVNEEAQTATLKGIADKKLYKDVPFAELK